MQVVWDIMSDSKIWSLLGDVGRRIDEDITRLMFIELFSRIRKLEEENMALTALLLEENVVDSDMYDITLKSVRDFLKKNDREKTEESNFFASSGIPFPEWVNFKLTGRFGKPEPSSGVQ